MERAVAAGCSRLERGGSGRASSVAVCIHYLLSPEPTVAVAPVAGVWMAAAADSAVSIAAGSVSAR